MPIDLSHYQLVLEETFQGTVCGNATQSGWAYASPWPFGDNYWLQPAGDSGQPVFSCDANGLIIWAYKMSGSWYSGLVSSTSYNDGRDSILQPLPQWGFYEVEMKFPDVSGIWPAFWLNSLNVQPGEAGVEIDVIEYFGVANAGFGTTVHIWQPDGSDTGQGIWTTVSAGSLNSDFHSYAVDVEPDNITFYLDREPFWQYSTPAALTHGLAIITDFAMGGGWPVPTVDGPLTMNVNVVRYFAPPPGGIGYAPKR